jgi:hypothetical protein
MNRVNEFMDQRKGVGPWSMVDRASYPFGASNLGHPDWFRRSRANGDEMATVVGIMAELCSVGVADESIE